MRCGGGGKSHWTEYLLPNMDYTWICQLFKCGLVIEYTRYYSIHMTIYAIYIYVHIFAVFLYDYLHAIVILFCVNYLIIYTGVLIGAWKWNFPPFRKLWLTDQRTKCKFSKEWLTINLIGNVTYGGCFGHKK